MRSLKVKQLSYWKLMLRDGLNLYASIWLVNMVNMLFWFIMKPTGPEDPIKTIVTSMAAVLTTSMTLRIILSVRGTLKNGGSYAVSSTSHSHSPYTRVRSTSATYLPNSSPPSPDSPSPTSPHHSNGNGNGSSSAIPAPLRTRPG